jgi:outer membrane protein insertion porin family
MFVGTVGITFSNFSARKILDLKSWRPVPTGDGQTLSVRAQTNGKYYQSYNLSFVEPWFGGKKPNSFSFSMYYSKYNQSNYSYISSSGASDKYMKIRLWGLEDV